MEQYEIYEKAKEAAILKVKELNLKDDHKWKSISMTRNGCWIASDLPANKMKLCSYYWTNINGCDHEKSLDIQYLNPLKNEFKDSLIDIKFVYFY